MHFTHSSKLSAVFLSLTLAACQPPAAPTSTSESTVQNIEISIYSSTPSSLEAAGFVQMSGDEIRATLAGNSVDGTDEDGSYVIHYQDESSMKIRRPSGVSDVGVWRVDGNLYCRKWTRGREGCKSAWKKGDVIYWYSIRGQRFTDKTVSKSGNFFGLVNLVNPPHYPVGTEWVWEKNAGTLVTRRVTESNGSTYKYKDSDGCTGSTNTEMVGGGSWQNCLGSTGWTRPTDRSGSLYPLSVGNSEQITFIGQLEGQSSQFRTASTCSVDSLEEISVPAGTFDAYRISCEDPNNTTVHYFGTEIGTRLIWDQFNKKNGKRNTYKLVSFKRG